MEKSGAHHFQTATVSIIQNFICLLRVVHTSLVGIYQEVFGELRIVELRHLLLITIENHRVYYECSLLAGKRFGYGNRILVAHAESLHRLQAARNESLAMKTSDIIEGGRTKATAVGKDLISREGMPEERRGRSGVECKDLITADYYSIQSLCLAIELPYQVLLTLKPVEKTFLLHIKEENLQSTFQEILDIYTDRLDADFILSFQSPPHEVIILIKAKCLSINIKISLQHLD